MNCPKCGSKMKKQTVIMTRTEAIANGIPEDHFRKPTLIEFIYYNIKNYINKPKNRQRNGAMINK